MPDPTIQAIEYTVRFPVLDPHYVEIEARIPVSQDAAQQLAVELFLPVWTPGSYMVREYSRHVATLTARDAQNATLPVAKTRKNRWLVQLDHALDEITISYRLYCYDLTVRTNFRDETFAVLHGAATFLTLVEGCRRPHHVTVELPPHWAGSWSGITGDANTFVAPDYDALVDSPVVAGSPTVVSFAVDSKPHFLLNFGDSSYWDTAKAAEDIERLVLQHRGMWGGLPYDRYLFLNLITGGRGALEHANSMVLMADRFSMRTRAAYTAWLGLVSHEFFHVWNVKRLRPVELGPFDYENEVYTRNLWIAEGFTEYYGPLAVRRAGLITTEEFLGSKRPTRTPDRAGPDSLSGWIEELQNTPGRLEQPVAGSSFDAWIKLYRPDENSPNSTISYYTKGAVIAWLLDARIRAVTGGARTLDDLMLLAWQRFGGARGFSSEDFYATAHEVTGVDLTGWLKKATETTEELEYSEALAWFGLCFRSPGPALDQHDQDGVPKAWLGIKTRVDTGRLIVTQVPRDTPGYAAGISPDDEILGLDDYRVRPDQWDVRLEQYRPHEAIRLMVSRRDRLLTLTATLGERPSRRWALAVAPDATDIQKQHLNEWLG